MEKRKNKYGFITGAFIVVAIAIFLVTIFTLGSERNTFTKKFSVKVRFNDINGLKVGNNVWFYGVKIGTVQNVDLKGASDVQVVLNIDKKVHQLIKANAMAKIGSDGFLGNKIVIIFGGDANMEAITSNGYLQAEKDTLTTEDMLATLQKSNNNLLEITNNLKAATGKIKTGEGTIGQLVNNPVIANMLHSTLNDFKIITEHGKKSVNSLEDFTARLDSKNSSINKLFADTLMFDSVKAAMNQLAAITETASKFTDNLNAFGMNLKAIGNNLQDTTNSAGLLLNDKRTADNLKVIVESLKSASKKLNDDLEALQHNFLLRGFFKKKKK